MWRGNVDCGLWMVDEVQWKVSSSDADAPWEGDG